MAAAVYGSHSLPPERARLYPARFPSFEQVLADGCQMSAIEARQVVRPARTARSMTLKRILHLGPHRDCRRCPCIPAGFEESGTKFIAKNGADAGANY